MRTDSHARTRNRCGLFVERMDQRSAEAQRYRRWYKGKPWLTARAIQLSAHPLCERCLQQGRVTPATVVNHRVPHKGNWSLFIDPKNHESTCKPHHDGLVQREERRGHAVGSDADGRPVDPLHPWNATRSVN